MKLNHYQIIAAAILMLSAGRLLAEEPGPIVRGQSSLHEDVVARFGWWGLDVDGSPNNVGEWDGLDTSSPFWDVDGLVSDGRQTVDFFGTGTENKSNHAGLYFYAGPRFSLDFDYDRFLHRFNHDPLGGLPDTNGFPPPGGFFDPVLSDGGIDPEEPGYPMFGEDLTVNRDYAIRVQKMETSFKGNLTENIKWRLNLWGMRKDGFRQANSQQHCFNATHASGDSSRTCHVVSQGQRIDWLTMEIQPVIEARFGWLSAEYSHTLRSFQQNDRIVTNDFTVGFGNYGLGGVGAYAYVPENVTEIDRIKLHGQIAPNTEAYVTGHVGNTHNQFRESDRKFYGVDARVTNTSIDGLSITGYGKTYTQNNSPDTRALNARYPAQAGLWREALPPQSFYGDPADVDNPYLSLVDREFTKVGVKGRWRPFRNRWGPVSNLAVTGGYEYSQIERANAGDWIRALEEDGVVPPTFTQPTTKTNMFFVGLNQDWSACFNSYVRYRMVDSDFPLLGITPRNQLSLDSALNTNLPEHEDRVEIGGTWTPTYNFLVNASFWMQNTFHHSTLVDFDEDNYPIVVSAWYAPNNRWSFSGGYATFSNWINQDITLGREDGSSGSELVAWTSPWNYSGRSDVVNLGTAFMVNCDTTLTGGFEYVRGVNSFNTPPSPPTAVPPYRDLPGYSRVEVNTYRFTAGVDHELSRSIGTFFRYIYYDFDNQGAEYDAGTAHMFLAGVSATY